MTSTTTRRSRALAGIALAAAALLLAPGAGAEDPKEPGPEEPENELFDAQGYVEMPAPTDGSYTLASPVGSGHNFGRPEFIRFLLLVAREWHKRHPELPKLCVGDMSHKDASDFPPHKTHKDGLTADIVTRPVNICDVKYENTAAQIELAELFESMGARQILFNGDAVVAKIKIAQKYDKHDDHYHVVADPKRIPDDGKPVLLPVAELADGASFGGAELDHAGKGLRLAWHLVAGASEKVKSVHAWLAETGDSGATLWDSGPQKPGKDSSLRVPVPVEDGKKYRWRLEVELASGVASFDWQTITADLRGPAVAAEAPVEGGLVATAPRVSWRFEKTGAEQASFVLELSDRKGGKLLASIGPIAGKETSYALDATPLARDRTTFWRVRARDVRGNEGVSEWRSFKTTSTYRFAPLGAKTLVACSQTAPEDAVRVVGKLKKGEEVVVLGESDTRYLVSLPNGSQAGLVPRSALEVRHTSPAEPR